MTTRHNARSKEGERCAKCGRLFGWREYIGRDDDGIGTCRNTVTCQAIVDRRAMLRDHLYEREAYAPPHGTWTR